MHTYVVYVYTICLYVIVLSSHLVVLIAVVGSRLVATQVHAELRRMYPNATLSDLQRLAHEQWRGLTPAARQAFTAVLDRLDTVLTHADTPSDRQSKYERGHYRAPRHMVHQVRSSRPDHAACPPVSISFHWLGGVHVVGVPCGGTTRRRGFTPHVFVLLLPLDSFSTSTHSCFTLCTRRV